jgi:hypothetical protein
LSDERGAVETSAHYFEHRGRANTEEVLTLVSRRAAELGIEDVVIPSTSGTTGLMAVEALQGLRVSVVTHSVGFTEPGHAELPTEVRDELLAKGALVHTGTHAFGGVGRAVRKKFTTWQVDEIVAQTLKRFGEGVKVAVEVSLMAADGGLISVNREVISCGGSGRGLDSALVLRPTHVQSFFDLEVLEIICKPRSP